MSNMIIAVNPFEATLQSLGRAFTVRDIATYDLITCREDDAIDKVLKNPDYEGLDYIPVKNQLGTIIGILERPNIKTAPTTAGLKMRHLDDEILASADTSLIPALERLVNTGYLLILDQCRVSGIVTKADIQKMPVVLLAFTFLVHIESLMAKAITSRCKDEQQWIELLDEKNQDQLRLNYDRQVGLGFDLPRIVLTGFLQKMILVIKLYKLSKEDSIELDELKDLRNQVAHSRFTIKNDEDVQLLVKRINLSKKWIDCIPAMINEGLSS